MPRTLLALLALAAAAAAAAPAGFSASDVSAAAPPPVKISRQVMTGLSSGAFFAVQYHISYSSELIGAGIIAGGPFYCAEDEEGIALSACMSSPELLDVNSSVSAAIDCAKDSSACDPLSNLATQPVWLFSGTKDTEVDPGVMKVLQASYAGLGVPSSMVEAVFNVPAEHAWITNDWGNSCGIKATPYINNCGLDASAAMLTHIFGANVTAPGTAKAASLYTLPQSSFVAGGDPSSISAGPNAYVYVPDACASGAECTLVTAMHGCAQTMDDIGFDFVSHIGMNELAETNNLVILYPQAIRSYVYPNLNPEGCWNWWGYGSDTNYSNKMGLQMTMVNKMMNSIAGN